MTTKNRNIPEPESKTPQSEIASDPTQSNVLGVAVDNLPKVIMCFDINTLSHQKLKTIASDLKLPGYSQMTKEQLCEALLGL